ncbi:MAG: hypothetical protein KDB90_05985 [Planctomycetes bacterium]|nr:hypothetical protein [Planctomycetota bacterium]
MRLIAMLLCLATLTGATLQAQHTWTGATSADWGTASNWNQASVPTDTDSVVIPDTSSLPFAPTLSTGATCNNLTLNSGAVLTGSNGTLDIYGDWVNDGTFVQGTSVVYVQGSNVTSIGGSVATTFYRLVILKTARSIEVNQAANMSISYTSTTTGTPGFDIRQGTYRNNGYDITIAVATVGGTTPAAGELHISGGTCQFNQVYQFSQLRQFTITGGTVTIAGQHSVVNSGNRFDMSGGSLTYTSTSNSAVRCLSNNGTAWGWNVTGGDVYLHGGFQSGTSNNTFLATGSSVVHFVGTANVINDFASTPTSGPQNVSFADCRIEKTGGATVSFATTNVAVIQNSIDFGSITVASTAGLTFGNQNFTSGDGWVIGTLDNAGTTTLSTPTIRISGDITNTGTLTSTGSNSLYITGTATSTISGSCTFENLTCDQPGRQLNFSAGSTQTVNGTLTLKGFIGAELVLRSTSSGSIWNLTNSGSVVAEYCNVQDSTASATINVVGGTDSGNNTNWNFGGSASGQSWTGAVSTDWATAGNWNPAVVPTTTTNVTIPDTTSLPNAPTLAATSNCQNIVIEAGAVLTGGSATFNVYGHWSNSGTFTAGTSQVFMSGNTSTIIGGTSSTAFYRLIINKGSRSNEVSQLSTVSATYPSNSTSSPGLDIRRGTYRNNGNDLSVATSYVGANSLGAGELHISGGTCVFNYVYQASSTSSLRQFTITGGDVTINQTHTIYNTGQRFDMSGGSLTYLSTSTSSVSLSTTNGSGWFATGGDIYFTGGINLNISSSFMATGASVVHFIGTGSTTVNTFNSSSTNSSDFYIEDCRIEKTATATVTVTAGSGELGTDRTFGSLTVNTGNTLSLPAINFALGKAWYIGSVTNAGTVSISATPVIIPGDINNTGTFTGNSGSTVQLVGTAASTITGNTTFFNVECVVPGRQINFGAGSTITVNGQLFFEGASGNEIDLRSTSAGTAWNLQKNGSALPRYCDVQDSTASSTVYAQPGGVDSGNNTNWVFGGSVSILPTVGGLQGAWANDVSGLVSGTFLVENGAATAVTLNSITIGASGTGDDSTGYSEVALYIDHPTSGSQGSFDAADTLYDAAVTAFGTDNGTITFTDSVALAASANTRFFVVVKFDGSTMPSAGETFTTNVNTISVTGAPTSGLPSAFMRGFVMNSATLTVSFPVTNNRPVAPTYLGPANDGFVMERFQVVNNSPLPIVINHLDIRAFSTSSTTAPVAIFTSVELFADANDSGNWERSLDTQIGTAYTSWTGTAAFNNTSIGPNETKLYFTVVKLNGSTAATSGQYGHFFYSTSSAVGATFNGQVNSGSYRMTIATASLYTVAEPGTKVEVPATDNTLREAGTFAIHNTSAATAVTLNSVTLTASGTGADNTAYSQVSLYLDSNTNGSWDGADALAATAITAFSSNDGSAGFSLLTPLSIAGAASQRFFVVVRMNGSTPASPQETFKTRVTAIGSTVSGDGSGLPSSIMEGIEILGNRLTAAATVGTAVSVLGNAQGSGGNGVEAGKFTVTNTGLATSDLLSVTVRASGTANDSTAYSEVAIYEDSASGSVGSFDFANDTLIGTAATTFPTDDGALTFNVQAAQQSFTVSQVKTYFVVVKLSGSATPGQTLQYEIESMTVGASTAADGVPTSTMAGLTITTPFSASATAGTSTGALANATGTGGNGLQAGIFSISTSAGGGADLLSITITASGTGNDNTAYSEVAVYRDGASGATGSYDFANDTLIGTAATAFPADNGALTFNVQAGEQTFAASESRTYFVVVKLNGSATGGQTFQYQLTGVTSTPSGVSGLPTTVMAGINITTPFTASATVGTAANVYANAAGTGGNGIQSGLFTITSAAGGTPDLLSLTITASGSGDDSADFSQVAIYRDSASGTTGAFDFANDILIGTAATAFPADNGALTFTVQAAQQAFASAETRTYFVVTKLAGSANPGNTFQFTLTGMTSSPSGVTGLPTSTMAGLSVVPPFTASATAGTALPVYSGATGTGGNGVQAGVFTIANAAGVADLLSITVTSSGTGDDSAAYSEVAIYRDGASGTTGSFDFANDTLIGTAATAFPSNNGALTFTVQSAEQTFSATETRTYFVVVKLNGSAGNAETFQYTITALTNTPTGASGLPTTTMAGLTIQPEFTVSATAGSAQGVFANDTGTGGNGLEAGVFTIQAGSSAANLTSVTVTASGSGDDSTAYSEVALYRDGASGTTGSFDFANDTLIGTAVAAFPANDGALAFTVQAGEQAFSASETRTYFVVVKLNGTAATAETFQYTITGVAPAAAGTPSATMLGLSINAPTFTITDVSSATQVVAYAGTGDNVVQQFTIDYPNGQNNTLTTIDFTGTAGAGGTLTTDVTQVDLYRDANANSTYDAGVDTLVNSQAAFNGSNQVTFTLSGTESQFAAGDSREYFVVLEFSITTPHMATFATQLTAASGAATGTNINGTPAPAGGPTAGLIVNANSLFITLNGPGAAVTVDNNSQGAGGLGHVIWDGTLSTQAVGWTVNGLVFEGTGTANANTAYNFLALYEDTNTNTTFDAADQLAVAAAGTSFDATNMYTATLTNTAFPTATTRQFFLVGKLAGTATFGETLNARLTSVQATPPTGGQVSGDINVDSTALIIDAAAVTVGRGPTPPTDASLLAGTAQSHVLAKFRFTATNADVTVTSLLLTTSGTGNWVADLSSTNGVEVWEDDGDGVFNAGSDTMLFQGPGSGAVNASFSPSLQVPNSSTKDVWVRLNLLASAGVGSPTPVTYSLSVLNASDVQAGSATPLLGTPLPTSSVLSMVDFFVTTFTPTSDFVAGGAAITIVGSGFVSSLTVTIGGVICPGVPVITGGTQVTGLLVPAGSGKNLPIVVTSGALAPQTLTQTFSYSTVSNVGGGGGGDGGGGCVQSEGQNTWLLLAALIPVVMWFRRRRSAS